MKVNDPVPKRVHQESFARPLSTSPSLVASAVPLVESRDGFRQSLSPRTAPDIPRSEAECVGDTTSYFPRETPYAFPLSQEISRQSCTSDPGESRSLMHITNNIPYLHTVHQRPESNSTEPSDFTNRTLTRSENTVSRSAVFRCFGIFSAGLVISISSNPVVNPCRENKLTFYLVFVIKSHPPDQLQRQGPPSHPLGQSLSRLPESQIYLRPPPHCFRQG